MLIWCMFVVLICDLSSQIKRNWIELKYNRHISLLIGCILLWCMKKDYFFPQPTIFNTEMFRKLAFVCQQKTNSSHWEVHGWSPKFPFLVTFFVHSGWKLAKTWTQPGMVLRRLQHPTRTSASSIRVKPFCIMGLASICVRIWIANERYIF